MITKRVMPLSAAFVLITGGIGASVLFAGGTADAATESACTGANAFGAACTITGTLTLISGTLTLTAPPAVAWGGTISGVDQQLVDTTAADQTYTVNDATGTAPGWHVTASATPFVGATSGNPLGTAGSLVPTFSTNGSGSDGLMTDTTSPGANCAGTSTCTLPTHATNPVTYPVTITIGQAASSAPFDIYDADVGSGLGTIVLGHDGATGANPVGWWVNVPSNTLQDTYVSTISLELIAGP